MFGHLWAATQYVRYCFLVIPTYSATVKRSSQIPLITGKCVGNHENLSTEKLSLPKYYCELIEERKGDSTKIWRAINAVSRNPKSFTPKCIVSNGVQHTDPTAFNSFFASVDQTLTDKFSYFCSKFSKSKEVQVGSFCLKEIDESFVFKQLRSLKPKQSDWFGQNQCTAAEMCVFLGMFFSHQITKCLNFPNSNQTSQKSCSLPTLWLPEH